MAARSKTIKIRREPQPTGEAVLGEASHRSNSHPVSGRAGS
jgi:hypothetical protein